MTADSPTPAEEPKPPAPRRRHNWHRIRVYSYSIVLMLTMWFCDTVVTIRLHPDRLVAGMLAQLPFPASVGKVSWLNRRTLELDDVRLGDMANPQWPQFFYADAIIFTASPFGMLRHHVAKVQIFGGQLYTKPLYAAMDQIPAGNGKGLDWVIGRLELNRCTFLLNNLIANTAIPVRLGVRHPAILTMLRLGEPDASPEMNEERTMEVGTISIPSPFDPIVPVLVFPLTQVRYTYSEVWHHHIRAIEMIRPTIYLGEDLFWFTDQFKNQRKETPAQGPKSPWEVGRFSVRYGRLAVSAFGQPVARLPFFFETQVDNIRIDQLDQISAKSNIAITNLTQDYPDYKVKLVNLRGNLYFSWPPTDANANNVVNTIEIDEISWNNIPVKKVSATVTFDPNGVYGRLTDGTCEGGLLNGNFEFYYTKGFTWNADFFATKINCQPIAKKLAGKYIDLTGELDGKIAVQGKSTEILNCAGSLNLPSPGLLEIKSMDDLLNRIPPDMIKLKKDAITLAVNSFKTYPYDSGLLTLNYKPSGGLSRLKLDGPRGARQFEIYLHPWGDDSGNPGEAATTATGGN